jgi:hypothetical protein
MKTESEEQISFFDLDIYRRPDGSLGHKVYRKPPHTNIYLNDKSHHHPSNREAALSTRVHRARLLCNEDSLQAELMFLRDVFRQNGYNERQIHRALNRRPHLDQPGNKPNSVAFLLFVGDYIQPNQQRAGPTQHQICGLAPHHIIQSPPSCPRPPRTKDTRCLQDPL